MFDAVLRRNPFDREALRFRAFALWDRARRSPGPETSRLLSEAVLQVDEAERAGADSCTMAETRGVLLWAQARCAGDETSARLLQLAKEKFTQAESLKPRLCAYNLACVHALLGESEACKRWLEISREPGLLVSYDQMATEPDLQAVWACEWFRGLLNKGGFQPGADG